MEEIKRAAVLLRGEADGKPLALRELLFCPVLAWLGRDFLARGISEVLLLCEKQYQTEALACFDGALHVAAAEGRSALYTFCQNGERTLLISGAALPVELSGGRSVYEGRSAAEAEAVFDGAPGARTAAGYTAVSSFAELCACQLAARDRLVDQMIAQGVCVMDPHTTYIDPRVRVGAGTVILPGTILRGDTVIGKDCEIGPNSVVDSCRVGDGTVVNASQINESTVGSRTKIGPFAYVRPGCVIGDEIKVGDFVEVKNSTLGNGTKISHLTYVGDSDVGEHVNFGCGTVTVNFDGKDKYRCTIGDHVFLGCNTNLVAPVAVGTGAYTAAGSTITEDVPEGDLGIARTRQSNLPQWAEKRRAAGKLR